MKSIIWEDDSIGAKFKLGDIPADMREEAEKQHVILVEIAAESDEILMQKYLDLGVRKCLYLWGSYR